MDCTEVTRFIPFVGTQLLYWTTFLPASEPCLLALVIKCLPVLSLILYILLSPDWPKDVTTHRKIMFGLVFGVLGDALLVYDNYFVFGMVAFGIGHVFYMSAFEFGRQLSIKIGVLLLLILIAIGVPIYSCLLLSNVWCAISRAETGIQMISAIGAATFAVSDFLIVFNIFYHPLVYSQVYIMSTYYAAQFCITLSASEIFVRARKLKTKRA